MLKFVFIFFVIKNSLENFFISYKINMTLWILLALLGTVFAGLASVWMDFVARDKTFDNNEDLVLQYKFEIISVLVILWIFSLIWLWLNPIQRNFKILWILILIWIIGFAWIYFLYKWFEKLNPAIVLIIAQLNIFIMYFANVQFFDSSEQLSLHKIFLALLFFIVSMQFLLPDKKIKKNARSDKKFDLNVLLPDLNNLKINKFALYPIFTALSWACFTFAFIYLTRNWTFTPVQSVFATETAVWFIAFLYLFLHKEKFISFTKKLKKTTLTQIKPYIVLGVFQIIWAIIFGYSYLYAPANMVNVIRLFQIILTAIFARILFKQKLSQRNIFLIILSFLILIAFVSIW